MHPLPPLVNDIHTPRPALLGQELHPARVSNHHRLQEQLLEVKAREAKLGKEREGLEGAVARLEAQRVGLDAELAQMRRMLEDAGGWLGWLGGHCTWNAGVPIWYQCGEGSHAAAAAWKPRRQCTLQPVFPAEARCQASHKAAMEAANEAKRLAPLEPRAARLEEALAAAGQELERVQREVTSHQQTIRWACGLMCVAQSTDISSSAILLPCNALPPTVSPCVCQGASGREEHRSGAAGGPQPGAGCGAATDPGAHHSQPRSAAAGAG